MTNRIPALTSIALLSLCTAFAQAQTQSSFAVTTDSSAFLKSESGQPWKHIILAKEAQDTAFARIEIAFECVGDGTDVFFDEARILIVPRSKDSPDSDLSIPASSGAIAKESGDWRVWQGLVSIDVTSNLGSRKLSFPAYDLQAETHDSKQSIALRLNPGPARPREVVVLAGGARAIANRVIQTISVEPSLPMDTSFSIGYLSQSGIPKSASFDLVGIEKTLAISIHKHCGNK
jgi:hypothetical protein